MHTRHLPLTGLTLAVAGTLTACSMSSGGGSAATDRDRVTREELASTNSSTVYQALELLRPRWLNSRGAASMGAACETPPCIANSEEARANVYMNGTRVGELEYLREVYVMDVAELRYWPPGQASARFGMGNPRGVIEIIPRT